ncbi:MAG TPA: NAD(P)H-dependent glycerol-3-phosphate dehydrogenase [Candidatus Eisenbacteria bacterium]|nr:NAD(P)H-dependent glycerol-3-phosphate dehydrogenase [Candidatus Eisenbacteria bacterium]
MSRVAVLGPGSWGTTLAVHLAQAGNEVALWGNDATELEALASRRENVKFLPGIALPRGVNVQPQLEAALEGAEFTLFVVPSQAVRAVAAQVRATGARSLWVCASKGLEVATLGRLSEALLQTLDDAAVVLTGPSHAEEVSRGIPTSVVAACADEARARRVQALCSTGSFRVYTNADVAGCEYGAALKNVIAIAAGVCDGLGFGDNTKGALLTRGLHEMARVGVALGGRRETFFGLSGLGDLIATAMSRHSRNRHVGECIGRGESLERVLAGMVMVAEGVTTARAARDIARARGIDVPIIEQVAGMLFESRPPREALQALMSRELKAEN